MHLFAKQESGKTAPWVRIPHLPYAQVDTYIGRRPVRNVAGGVGLIPTEGAKERWQSGRMQ